MTPLRVRLMIAATWIVSFVTAGFGCLTRWAEEKQHPPIDGPFPPVCFHVNTGFIIATALLSVLLPSTVIAFTSFHIFRAIRQQLKRISPQTILSPVQETPAISLERENKMDIIDLEPLPEKAEENQNQEIQRKQNGMKEKHETSTIPKTTVEGRPMMLKVQTTHNRRQPTNLSNGERRLNKTEIKAARAVGLVVVALFTMWSPFYIILFISSVCYSCHLRQALQIGIWIGCSNSAINPLLYAKNKDFRQAYRKVLHWSCTPLSTESNSSKSLVTATAPTIRVS
ncbi:D(3) dopamine receptor-like [Glandiceps talaboti]